MTFRFAAPSLKSARTGTRTIEIEFIVWRELQTCVERARIGVKRHDTVAIKVVAVNRPSPVPDFRYPNK